MVDCAYASGCHTQKRGEQSGELGHARFKSGDHGQVQLFVHRKVVRSAALDVDGGAWEIREGYLSGRRSIEIIQIARFFVPK